MCRCVLLMGIPKSRFFVNLPAQSWLPCLRGLILRQQVSSDGNQTYGANAEYRRGPRSFRRQTTQGALPSHRMADAVSRYVNNGGSIFQRSFIMSGLRQSITVSSVSIRRLALNRAMFAGHHHGAV